jgi:hypothetical protein
VKFWFTWIASEDLVINGLDNSICCHFDKPPLKLICLFSTIYRAKQL